MGEEDEFWQVAFSGEDQRRSFIDDESGDYTDDERPLGTKGSQTELALPVTYKIPWRSGAPIQLRLSPLPDNDGVWSPLGAQAWYASSLLVSYMLQDTIIKNKEGTHEMTLLSRYLDTKLTATISTPFTALELGSGAVGLAGIVLGLILGEMHTQKLKKQDAKTDIHLTPRVVLTDNDADVVERLEFNVNKTLTLLKDRDERIPTRLSTGLMDWNHYDNSILPAQSSIQLVVGSELVYTNDTAQACAKVVRVLLKEHPEALIYILQVADRDGWSNIFIPTIRKHSDLAVIEESVQNSDLHDLASSLIPQGGTLDRFAFGACYIFNRTNSVVAKLAGD